VRIGVNAALLGDRYYGVDSYILGLIGCLADLGHEVTVYTSSPRVPGSAQVKLRRSCKLLRFDKGPGASALRFLWNQAVLPLRLIKDSIDVVFCQNIDAMLRPPVSQILVIHDIIPLLYPEEAPGLHKYYKFVLPRTFRRADALVTVSDTSRKDIIKCYGAAGAANICVGHEGVGSAVSNPAKDRKPSGFQCQSFFLFVGTFCPRKNLATVIEALAMSGKEIGESLVVVAYADKWMPAAMQKIAELNVSERVVFLSDLQPEELGYLYDHATALFLLSEYEGFGLPVLEAMSAGTPAVVSDTGALAEVVGDAAIKIKAHDVNAAAAIMSRLSVDQQFRQEWQRKGLQRSRAFTWQRTGEQLARLLQDFS